MKRYGLNNEGRKVRRAGSSGFACALVGMAGLVLFCCCSASSTTDTERLVKVGTVEVAPCNIDASLRYSATLDAADGSTLSFSSVGVVRGVYVRDGQCVAKGTLLADLDDVTLRSAYDAAKALMDQAEDGYTRTKPLYEKGVIATVKWVEVETKRQEAVSAEAIARRALDDTRLVSPCGGYVTDLNLDAGQNVAIGIPVMRVVDIDRMRVDFSVPEREVSRFSVGMSLNVSVAALGGRHFRATVSEVSMVADRLSRTYKVSAVLPNPDHALRVGMIGEVWIDGMSRSEVIPVPSSAVLLAPDGACYVWVVEQGRAVRRMVRTGDYVGDSVVVDGLRPGERIIVHGRQKVSSGMAVAEQ